MYVEKPTLEPLKRIPVTSRARFPPARGSGGIPHPAKLDLGGYDIAANQTVVNGRPRTTV